MNKNVFLLFVLVNMTFLTIQLTPSKIVMFIIVVIVFLRGYKKIFNYTRADKFKISLFSNNQTDFLALKLLVLLLTLAFQYQSTKMNLSFALISALFLVVTLLVPSETLGLAMINICFLCQIVRSLQLQNLNKLRKKLGIIQSQSIYMPEEQLNGYLQVPQKRIQPKKNA